MRLRIMSLDSFWGFSRLILTMELMINPKKIFERCTVHRGTMQSSNFVTKSLIKYAKIYKGEILSTSSDRKLIRRNRSENRNILARIDNLQIIINHDVMSRVCGGRQLEPGWKTRQKFQYIARAKMSLKLNLRNSRALEGPRALQLTCAEPNFDFCVPLLTTSQTCDTLTNSGHTVWAIFALKFKCLRQSITWRAQNVIPYVRLSARMPCRIWSSAHAT